MRLNKKTNGPSAVSYVGLCSLQRKKTRSITTSEKTLVHTTHTRYQVPDTSYQVPGMYYFSCVDSMVYEKLVAVDLLAQYIRGGFSALARLGSRERLIRRGGQRLPPRRCIFTRIGVRRRQTGVRFGAQF